MSSNVYNKEYIKGIELLNRNWNVGDEIVYNSDPEDIGNEYLHLNYGKIRNILTNNKNKEMIDIHLPYGKIIIPLHNITLQFIPKTKLKQSTKDLLNNKNNVNIFKIKTFFVYGTLRDDNVNNMSIYTKNWITKCKAESGRLYKFKLFKERYSDYPFAVQTGNKNDYINGRIISWNENNENIFATKLEIADRMEGFINAKMDNLYVRDIVNVLNESGDMIQAIAYYKNVSIEDIIYCKLYDEIPFGDWLKRDRSRDLSEYNPSAPMLQMLSQMMRNVKVNEELIDSLPLPPEELEEKKSDTDDEIESSDNYKLDCWEYFRISGDNIAIMNDCTMIKKFRSGIHTAYGKYIIRMGNLRDNTNIYKWTFKIVNQCSNDSVLAIGIASKVIMHLNQCFYQYEEFENYAYNVCNGYKVSQNMFEPYATIESKTNDMIEMELNMSKCTLSYYINGIYQGVAFEDVINDENISYQMAVSLETHKDEISLLNFQIIQHCND